MSETAPSFYIHQAIDPEQAALLHGVLGQARSEVAAYLASRGDTAAQVWIRSRLSATFVGRASVAPVEDQLQSKGLTVQMVEAALDEHVRPYETPNLRVPIERIRSSHSTKKIMARFDDQEKNEWPRRQQDRIQRALSYAGFPELTVRSGNHITLLSLTDTHRLSLVERIAIGDIVAVRLLGAGITELALSPIAVDDAPFIGRGIVRMYRRPR